LADPKDPEGKPPKDMDEAVSLDPLEFEEALKALLAVDPEDDHGAEN
jgi:hypothetical protein